MSENGDTSIVAQIYVTRAGSNPTVQCTHKVKSGAGFVVWHIHNNTGADVTNVAVTNFRTTSAHTQDLIIRSGSFEDLKTGPIPNGQQRTLPGVFQGHSGDVYDYDIEVDDHIAADPQLEI